MYKKSSRISINVTNELHNALKRKALDEGVTMKLLVTVVLDQYLTLNKEPSIIMNYDLNKSCPNEFR